MSQMNVSKPHTATYANTSTTKNWKPTVQSLRRGAWLARGAPVRHARVRALALRRDQRAAAPARPAGAAIDGQPAGYRAAPSRADVGSEQARRRLKESEPDRRIDAVQRRERRHGA